MRVVGRAHLRQVVAGVPLGPGEALGRCLLFQGIAAQEGVLPPAVGIHPAQEVAVAQRLEQVTRLLFWPFEEGRRGRRGKVGLRSQAAQGTEAALQRFAAGQGVVAVGEHGAEAALRLDVVQGDGIHSQAVGQAVGNAVQGGGPLVQGVGGMEIAQGDAQGHGVRTNDPDQPLGQRFRHVRQGLRDQGQGILLAEDVQRQRLAHRAGDPVVAGGNEDVGLGREGAADGGPKRPLP